MKNYLTIANVKRMAAIGLLATIAITYPLWITSHGLKPLPVFSWLSVYGMAHWISLGAIVAWVGYIIVHPKGVLQGAVAVALICVSLVMDLNRCQVWLLHFFYIFLLPDKLNEEETKISILFMVSLTYILSGLHKYNIGFTQETWPWLIKPFGLPKDIPSYLVVPGLEILFGFFLLVPRLSRWSSVGSVIMHTGIIYVLIYYQWNFSVIPWNATLIIYHILIAQQGGIKLKLMPVYIRSLPQMVCFFIFPTLSYFGFINRSFSFQLYSGNQYTGIVIFSDEAFKRLPNKIKTICEKLKRTQEPFLNLDRYAMREIGVPLFQDMKCYKAAAVVFIPYTRDDNDLVLLVRNGPEFILEKDLWAFTLAELSEQPVRK